VAINKSGRLRMLSQRGAKAWLLLVQGVLPDRAKSILAQSLASFEQILGELKTLQPGDDIRGLAQTLDQEWRAYRPRWPTSAPTPRRCGPTARPCSPLPRR
jgi:nitrate/nitrite-specific signal transduction histidine kinase